MPEGPKTRIVEKRKQLKEELSQKLKEKQILERERYKNYICKSQI